jgi:hypothetical protein
MPPHRGGDFVLGDPPSAHQFPSEAGLPAPLLPLAAHRPIKGTTRWTTYQIVLDVPEKSSLIAFGLLLDGPGKVWICNIHFEVVSNDVPTTPERVDQPNVPDQPINLDFKD